MKRIFLPVFIGFFLSVAGPAPAAAPPPPPPPAPVFGAESFALENGLRVVVIPNHRAPVVTHMVWYKTGAIDEPPGKSGIAHFLEHLMFKGSANVPSGEFSRRVRAMGGSDNAFTTQDYTAYYQSVAAAHLNDVMAMEADRMRGILLPADEFDPEREVVLEERRQRTESDPRAQMGEQIRASLFPGHPYGIPVIGWPFEIRGLTIDDAKKFHNEWYAPNNAILIISGDVTARSVRADVESIYGTIPARDVPERTAPPMMDFPGEPRLLMQSPDIHQPVFQRIMRVPSARQSKADSLALQVLENILSDGATSRLYRTLVVEQKIATGAGFGYGASSWDSATASLYAVPADNVAMDAIEKAINAVIDDVADNGVTDAEMAAARNRMKDSAALARDSLQGPPNIIGEALITGSTLDDIEYWPRDIESVTAADVQRVAGEYIRHRPGGGGQSVTAWMVPAPTPEQPETPKQDQDKPQ